MKKKQAKILGCPVNLLDFESAYELTCGNIQENCGMQIVTINPEMTETAKKNNEFYQVINNADLVIPDGVGIKLALKIKGITQQNIPGVEFSKKLIEFCAQNGYSVALLGAKEEILQKAKENLTKEFENLNICYARNGYFNSDEEAQIKTDMQASNPSLALIALGAPKQELLISKFKKDMPSTVFIGVGGSFDVWSGVVQRAPEIYQKLGLEWLYRTVQEPKRFKRIFPALPMFLIRVIIESVFQKKG